MCVCQNVQNHKYHTGEAFLEDVQLMHNNSMAYNGKDSTLTRTSLRMLQQCEEMIQEVRSPSLRRVDVLYTYHTFVSPRMLQQSEMCYR